MTYRITTFDSNGAPDLVLHNLTLEEAQAELDLIDSDTEYSFEEEA